MAAIDPWKLGQPAPAEGSPTWGDYFSTLTNVGGAEVGAALAGGTRWLADKIGDSYASGTAKLVEDQLRDYSTDSSSELSAAMQQRLNAAIGSKEFWQAPFGTLAAKATRMAPGVLAATAGLLVSPEVAPAWVSLAAGGGGLSAAQMVDAAYAQVDDLPDATLQERSAYYAGLRATGANEADARRQLENQMIGAKPAVAFALGAVTGAVGGPAQLGKVFGVAGLKAAEGGAATRLAKGALVGGGAGAAQTGGSDVLNQQAGVDAGLKEKVDPGEVLASALEGGTLGMTVGGPAEMLGGRARPAEKSTKPTGKAKPAPEVQTVEAGSAPDAAQTAALQTKHAEAAPPPKPEEVQQPNAAPAAPATPEAAAAPVERPAATPEAAPVEAPVARGPEPATVTEAAPQPTAVTPEVTSKVTEATPPVAEAKPAPAEPAVAAPGVVAATEAARGPRILLDQTKAKEAKAADRENLKRQIENEAAIKKEEAGPGSRKAGAEEIARKEQNANLAHEIFDKGKELVGDSLPTKPAEYTGIKAQLDKILSAAEDAGVDIPKYVTKGTPDHLAWLREVADIAKVLDNKGAIARLDPKMRDRVTEFMVRNKAAKEGDFSVLRESRKVEGDIAKGRGKGDAGEWAAGNDNAATEAEAAAKETAAAEGEVPTPAQDKEAVKTAVPASAKRSVNALDEERVRAEKEAPPPVKKVDVTPELAAKALAALETAKKREEVKAAKPEVTSKVTPKVAEVKAKVEAKAKPAEKPAKVQEVTAKAKIAAEAKKVETKPTEAQKKSGNYAKGHVKVHGLDITIENPKGSVRSGKDAGGKEWSVKMPDHYGYIKRTEGADGDHVDVYLGPKPDSEHVFVIDQVHPDTRAFDEHKVMLGYANGAAAADAYTRAFSDGRGPERAGDFRAMHIDEFKRWLKEGDTTKPAGEPEAAKMVAGDVKAARTADGSHLTDGYSGHEFVPIDSGETRTALMNLDLGAIERMGGVPSKMAPFMQKRLAELVGDVPIHIISEKDMGAIDGSLARTDKSKKPSWGMYTWGEDGHPRILISDAVPSNQLAHTVIHEAVHAVTFNRLTMDDGVSKIWQRRVEGMRKTVERFIAGLDEDLRKLILKEVSYGLTNTHEFLSEALSNPMFQELLAKIEAPKDLVAELGLAKTSRFSLWDTFINGIRKLLGLPDGTHTLLEAAVRTVDRLAAPRRQELIQSGQFKSVRLEARDISENVHAAVEALINRAKGEGLQEQKGKPWLLKYRPMDGIARIADDFFGKENNPVRQIADVLERTRVTSEGNLRADEPTIQRLYDAERKYAGATWKLFTDLVHAETEYGVYADRSLAANTQLGKDALWGVAGKAKHPELAAMYAQLPEDLKALRKETMDYFRDKQNAMSLALIKNRVLKLLDIEDDALAQRIHEGTTTDADRALIGADVLDHILEAKVVSKITGPYFPLMRRGDHGIRGELHIDAPTGPHFIRSLPDEPNTFEFRDRKAAIAFAQQQVRDGLRPEMDSLWVDKTSGDRYVNDNGTQRRILQQDIDAEQRFRVSVQNKHVEFFDGGRSARQAAAQLEGKGFQNVTVFERQNEMRNGGTDLMSYQMRTLAGALEKRANAKGFTDSMKQQLVSAMTEASLRWMGSTRIQSHRLPREYVAGFSKDLTQNTLDYAVSSNGYLARLQHQPALDAAMKEMRDQANSHYAKDSSLGMSSIANEVERRVAGNNGFVEGGKYSPAIKRVLATSFIARLASPAHSMVNALQPTLLTFPVLSGRYGIGRAFGAMSRAYADIGVGNVVKKGAVATAMKARRPSAETGNFLDDVKGRLKSADERAMLDKLAEVGLIDQNAGMEVSKLIKSRGQSSLSGKAGAAMDTGLAYLEGITREMPKAVEAINRTVTALAAYRLEMARNGGDHEAAVQHAQDVTAQTQFNYSTTNAAPLLNHPLAKLAFQFKKFGMSMYELLGEQVGKAIRNENEGDRAEALKTLGYIATTHMALAGALGLPLEPIKALVIGANLVGVTGFNWGDVENKERDLAAGAMGKTLGEMFSRGVTRGLPGGFAFDLSSRVGLDNLLMFQEPRDNTPDSVWKWAGQTMAGSPGSLVTDWMAGSQQLMNGNLEAAAEKLVPFKQVTNLIQAYRRSTEGKVSDKTGKQNMTPYSLPEAGMKAIGFTPGREAETSAAKGAFSAAQKSAKDNHSQLLTQWASAAPSERGKLWGKVEEFNKAHPEQKLTRAALDSFAKKQKTQTTQLGVAVSKRNTPGLQRVGATYNQ